MGLSEKIVAFYFLPWACSLSGYLMFSLIGRLEGFSIAALISGFVAGLDLRYVNFYAVNYREITTIEEYGGRC